MFDANSRYADLAQKQLTVRDRDGEPREIRYVERRFVPSLDAGAASVEHAVAAGDRLDNVTARYLGDPTQFWRVADANLAPRPEVLTDEPGTRIVIALPAR